MSVEFNFKNFGSLIIDGKKYLFSDLDTNNDGKIDNSEYEKLTSLLQEAGEDTITFSLIDRNKDKNIDENEFAIWEQKIEIQNSINNYNAIIAQDFAGASENTMQNLKRELKFFVEEFVNNYDGDISNMASDFKDIFPQNAVDIGILSKTGMKGVLYKYFRGQEKKLYQ